MLQAGLAALGNDEVQRVGADEFDIGARGVEVRVVGNDIAFLARDAEQDAFGGAALMRRDDVAEAEDVLDRIAEVIEAATARVALVAFHDPGPLVGRHSARAGIGEQVDEYVISGKEEQVAVGGT
jgi:hypothetical protein